jgi:deoxyxylulose-5-phosphate synthase
MMIAVCPMVNDRGRSYSPVTGDDGASHNGMFTLSQTGMIPSTDR